MSCRTASCLLILLSWSRITGAQELRTYVGGALAISPWRPRDVSGGSPSTTYVNASTETMVIGVVGEAGWYFNRLGAVGVEVAVPFQRNDLTQRFHYFNPYMRDSRYREQTAFIVVRGELNAKSRARVGLVGGPGAVRGSSLDRYASGRFGSTMFGPFGEERALTHTAIGVIVGADLAIEATRHVSVVPQFRILMIARGDLCDSGSSFADLGLPSATYRAGIGVRAAF